MSYTHVILDENNYYKRDGAILERFNFRRIRKYYLPHTYSIIKNKQSSSGPNLDFICDIV